MTGSSKCFLSCRREDSAGHAGRLADHLLDRYGAGSVFMNVESIEAGTDFTRAIQHAIEGSEAVIVVIGPGWLDATSSDGRRRLDNADDFVRREIEAALRSEVRVIPVLVGGATMPAGDRLPGAIAELARRNAVELQDRRWREDVDALVDVLEGRGKAVLGNLPVQPTPFLGRERELAEVTELLRRDEVRLLTLTGPGGIGKTRLAVQAASKLAHVYPGGAWFVGLAALTDPELLLAELAAVLDVQESGDGTLVDALAARLSRARTLVVLDNLEQLLPEAAGPLTELSAAAPTLELVVSSREPLHLAAEREYPVGTLPENESFTLFVERARAARPDFAPRDDTERQMITSICARLDHLPLAVELAAARIKLLPLAKLLERLEQRLPLLTGGAHDAPERQRTLRATISWSYELLSEDERRLFERVSVFSGGCTLEAAEAVADADLDTLQSLIERNLLREQDGRTGEPRYLMLETIREFALERLEERVDTEDLRRQHAQHFLTVAEAARDGMKSPEQRRWLGRMEAERDNFRTTLRWALDGPEGDLALRITEGLSWFWYLRGPVTEGRRWLAEALARAPRVTQTRAWVLDWAGFLAAEQADLAEAVPLLEESIGCAAQAGALAAQGLAMSHLSGLLPPDRAGEIVPLAREAVDLARSSGDRWICAVTVNSLGEALREVGDDAGATAAYQESLELRREMGDPALTALALVNLGEMAILAGDLPRARALADEALELATSIDDQRHKAFAVAALGWIALAERRIDDAASRLGEALEMESELGYPNASVSTLCGLAGCAAASGDAIRAARLEAVSARNEEALGHVPTLADSEIHRGYLDELRSVIEPAIWEAAAREGEAMSLDEGIAYALST